MEKGTEDRVHGCSCIGSAETTEATRNLKFTVHRCADEAMQNCNSVSREEGGTAR